MTPVEHKAIRCKLGLTQAGLAARLGVTRKTVNSRENGAKITEEAALAILSLSAQDIESATYCSAFFELATKLGYFIGVDHGNGCERSCRITIKVNHDGTKEIVEHDFFEENTTVEARLKAVASDECSAAANNPNTSTP